MSKFLIQQRGTVAVPARATGVRAEAHAVHPLREEIAHVGV